MITDVPNVIAANEFNYKTMTDGSYGELVVDLLKIHCDIDLGHDVGNEKRPPLPKWVNSLQHYKDYIFLCMCIIETSPQDTLRRPELYRRLPALTFDDNNINGRTEPNRAVEITHLRVQQANVNRSFATLRGNTNIVESIEPLCDNVYRQFRSKNVLKTFCLPACTNIWPSSSTNINDGSSSQFV
ncbi:hypothetical protein GQX74_002899 [Glossina fuscipes]|nr:hypothetical protein GQX74_002899 [Glossina fuscipes]